MSFKSIVNGQQTKTDHKSSACHYETGELKRILLFAFAISAYARQVLAKHIFQSIKGIYLSKALTCMKFFLYKQKKKIIKEMDTYGHIVV